jgi:hypothetical protein
MGETFPFEIGVIPFEIAVDDSELVQLTSSEIPEFLRVFAEKKIVSDLDFYDENYPLIIDYVESRNISQVFIPVIPLPLEEYDFYE